METAAATGEDNHGDNSQARSCWISSTNWTVSRGSLQDSICFESSSSISEGDGDDDDGDVSSSRYLLLMNPNSQDPAPCEITICFRERHEIHRVYVRSTARVYEIYYAPEQQSRSNEYLCTVPCGASAKEVMLPRSDTGEAVMNHLKDSIAPMEVTEKMIKSESNTSSNEDGWVDVKVPDSPSHEDGGNCLSKKIDGTIGTDVQICYEATADISDASPCISLTLRLLSLQTKGCVNVEEIYIYADPVESTDSGPSVSLGGNLTGNSFLAMLAPSLLQLSSSRIRDRDVSDNFVVQKYESDAAKATVISNPEIGRTALRETCSSMAEQGKGQVSVPTEVEAVIMHLDSDRQQPGPDQVPKSVPEENNVAYGRLERSVDELVSRVGRIETFFSRFEENMLKPISCIETRLQRLEQQLDALLVRTESSEPFQCSRISAPEFSFDESVSDDKGCDASDVVKEASTVDSPDVIEEDATVDSPFLPADDETASALAPEMCPGLLIKAPEFPNEDDEYIGSNDISDSAVKYCPKDKDKASMSIDDALTSALEAFMSSASAKSPEISPTLVEAPEFLNEVDHNCGLGEYAARVPCEEADVSGIIFYGTNREDNVNLDSSSYISSPKKSEEQGVCHQKWPVGGSIEETVEVSSDNHFCTGGDAISDVAVNQVGGRREWIDDSDAEETAVQVSNLNLICEKWNEDSSTDSGIDESSIPNNYNVDWTDESSTDSLKETFTLHNWLYGHQADHRFKEATSRGNGICDDLTTDIGDQSVKYDRDKSKVELERALHSTLNYEPPLLNLQFTPHRTLIGGSHLEALLVDMTDTEIKVSGNIDDERVKAGQQDNSFSLQGVGPDAPIAIDHFLIDLDELDVKSDTMSLEGSSNHQPFSSLI